MNMYKIVSPRIDDHLKAVARLRFFQRRLGLARQYGLHREAKGYEAHVCRALDLLWESQQRLLRAQRWEPNE